MLFFIQLFFIDHFLSTWHYFSKTSTSKFFFHHTNDRYEMENRRVNDVIFKEAILAGKEHSFLFFFAKNVLLGASYLRYDFVKFLSLTLSLSLSLTISLSPHTHSLSQTHTHTPTHAHTLPLYHTHNFSLSHTHTLSLSLSLPQVTILCLLG